MQTWAAKNKCALTKWGAVKLPQTTVLVSFAFSEKSPKKKVFWGSGKTTVSVVGIFQQLKAKIKDFYYEYRMSLNLDVQSKVEVPLEISVKWIVSAFQEFQNRQQLKINICQIFQSCGLGS